MIDFDLSLDDVSMDRRGLLRFGVGAGLLPLFAGNVGTNAGNNAAQLPMTDSPLNTYVKLLGSTEKSTIYLLLEGTLWGVAPGRSPEAICGFRGLARSDWLPAGHNRFSQHSFDVGFFSDLESGAPLDKVVNPMTGETVFPFHYKYGGEETFHTPETVDGLTKASWGQSGDNIYFTQRRSGTFPAPFPRDKWPRESSGDTYYFGSETSYLAAADQFSDAALKRYEHSLFWSSFLSWEPWLLMEGAPGFVMWRGIGSKLVSQSQVPKQLLHYIAEEQPNYFEEGHPWQGRESSYRRYRETRTPAD